MLKKLKPLHMYFGILFIGYGGHISLSPVDIWLIVFGYILMVIGVLLFGFPLERQIRDKEEQILKLNDDIEKLNKTVKRLTDLVIIRSFSLNPDIYSAQKQLAAIEEASGIKLPR